MKPLRLLPALLAATFLVGSAHAAPGPRDIAGVMRAARAQVVVPVAWDGVWASVDSSYTCAGVLQGTSTSTDTICGGKDYALSSQGAPIPFSCVGSTTSTTFDITCTAVFDAFTDCTATYTDVLHGTVSGGSSHIVSTLTITYSGTGFGCSSLPSTCTQSDSWGTRTGPAPSAFCTTPTLKSTWGQVKSIYR